MRYVVSERALGTIERECRSHPETETGGIIVGLRNEEQVTITHATGPGLNWERSAHHFVKDTEYLQSVLNLLFQYFQVNYLGLWHKHPSSMPFPSDGDVVSAMDEVSDSGVGLDELLTPICVMESSKVEVRPYVIKDHEFNLVNWHPVPHTSLASVHSLETQWHTRSVGRERLAEEQELFKKLGVEVDLREGTDGTYRFHVSPENRSQLRLVMLCPAEYPVAPPEVALYHRETKTVSNQQKWDTLGAERSGAGWRSGELPEGPVVASSPFGGLSLHLLPAL